MHHNNLLLNFWINCFVILLIVTNGQSTPLDDYVHDDDPHFSWNIVQTYDERDYKLYILNFTSLKWYDGKRNN